MPFFGALVRQHLMGRAFQGFLWYQELPYLSDAMKKIEKKKLFERAFFNFLDKIKIIDEIAPMK